MAKENEVNQPKPNKTQRVVEYPSLDAAKAAAEQENGAIVPDEKGRKNGAFRAYTVNMPGAEPIYVIARNGRDAESIGFSRMGGSIDTERSRGIPAPTAYVDKLSPEQLAELEKLVKAKKKELGK